MSAVAYTIAAILARPLPWERKIVDEDTFEEEGVVEDEDDEEEGGGGDSDEGEGTDDKSGDIRGESNEDSATESESDGEDTTEGDSDEDDGGMQRPWTMLDLVNSKIEWAHGQLVTDSYATVFGDFFTYAFHIPYAEAPDYDGWKARFRQAYPDLPDDMLYDPSDTYGKTVGTPGSITKIESLTDRPPIVKELWDSKPMTCLDGVKDGWRPTEGMIWHGPHSLEPEKVLGPGTEVDIVRRSGIQILQETPQSDIPLLASGCPQERMITL
ncbi:hypothetical protein V8D89_010989 [Ganoderma adspersum]